MSGAFDEGDYQDRMDEADIAAAVVQHTFTQTTLLSGQTVSMCVRCGLVEGADTDDERCIDRGAFS